MEFAATAERVTELIIQREGGEGYPGFPSSGQVFESAVAVGKGFDGGEGLDRIQVDTGRGSR